MYMYRPSDWGYHLMSIPMNMGYFETIPTDVLKIDFKYMYIVCQTCFDLPMFGQAASHELQKY